MPASVIYRLEVIEVDEQQGYGQARTPGLGDLLFQPVIVVVWRHDDPDQHIARPLRETAPRVRLTDHHLVEMPDLMLLVIDRVLQHPLYCLHAPGNNITPPNLFGITPSD